MHVYGVRCSRLDLIAIQNDVHIPVEYVTEFGLLIFPQYSCPTGIRAHGYLTDRFWAEVQRVAERPNFVSSAEREHPYLSDAEAHIVGKLRELYPRIETDWFYVPCCPN